MSLKRCLTYRTVAEPRRHNESDPSEITLVHLIFQSDPSENGAKNQFVAYSGERDRRFR